MEQENTILMLNEIYKQNPRHYLAVDCSIFGYEDGELKLLLYPREGLYRIMNHWRRVLKGYFCKLPD
jgi:hypothetical protein